jgi:putative PEP-CTERM system histidine kinase
MARADMMHVVSQWSHAVAAILFGALALWQLRLSVKDAQQKALVFASLATALWALITAMSGYEMLSATLGEQCRNIGWLVFMYTLWRQGTGADRPKTVLALYIVLGAVLAVQTGIELLPALLEGSPRLLEAVFLSSMVVRMMVAVGALVLVHNLYTAATPDARAAIRLPMIALAAMWTYDLNLYTSAYLARGGSDELFALRGVVLAILAPVFGMAARDAKNWDIRLSRSMTFQTLSLIAIGGYLMAMVAITTALQFVGGEAARVVQISFVFAASVAALLLLPSSKFRAWFRVKISKHLFRHRYDYRAEWLRFTDTIGRPVEGALPLEARIVQAVSDITESPGGLLLVPDATGSLVVHARWNWQLVDPPVPAATAATAGWFAASGRVVELDAVRAAGGDDDARFTPEWLLAESRAWAAVPLVHFEKLAGVVVLARPTINRTLDWEDFDLLRVVGRQVASYLAEARGQEALSDARRFDEFNRRFAFIMHDIKNLVSQLSLMTRNAEKHLGNPDFQADMIATLKNSTARMNDLLARLSQHNKGRAEEPRAVAGGAVAGSVAAAKRAQHPVVLGGESELFVVADPARLEQALGHLVQNAIDASPPAEPVSITLRREGTDAAFDVIDHGCGMSPAFLREKLFKAFASTKEGGFGIGAFEARAIVAAMGGRIDVSSREGEGSRFTIYLPLASEARRYEPEQQAAA